MLEELDGPRPSARADLYGGLFWITFGIAIAVASWNMDRLEKQGVSFYTAPGLVPGILGVLLVILGLVLTGRSLREGAMLGALGPGHRPPVLLNRDTLKRAGVALLLTLGFAVGLVGHGVPFPVAATLFLFLQIAILQYPDRKANNEVGKGFAIAAAVAVGAATAISLLFQYVFLVRLP